MPHLRIFSDRTSYDEERNTLVLSVKIVDRKGGKFKRAFVHPSMVSIPSATVK